MSKLEVYVHFSIEGVNSIHENFKTPSIIAVHNDNLGTEFSYCLINLLHISKG